MLTAKDTSIEGISQTEFWKEIISQSPFWKAVFEDLLGHEYKVGEIEDARLTQSLY